MRSLVSALRAFFAALCRSRCALALPILALPPQVAVSKQTSHRPRLRPTERLCWAWLSRVGPSWHDALHFVPPRPVIAWQQRRFRAHWRRWSPRGPCGRPTMAQEVRTLIRDLWRSHPTWGAPRIGGERRHRGIEVAKAIGEKSRGRPKKPPSQIGKTCWKNPRQDVVALDYCTVPTVTFRDLCVLVKLAHERRRVVHCNGTEHPTAHWTAHQVVEAFPWAAAPPYLLRDRDRIYGTAFRQRGRSMGIKEGLSAPRSPWQPPSAERLIGSSRREVLDHVIVLHAGPLQRLLPNDCQYDHRFRTPLSLARDGPEPRPVDPPEPGRVSAGPEGGGLHHHYARQAA